MRISDWSSDVCSSDLDDDGNVVGDPFFVDQLAHEIEVRLRCGGKADLDFLEADLDQFFEEAQFALDAHGFYERLIAVAQVGAHPDGGMGDALGGPGSFGEVAGKRYERIVLARRGREHVVHPPDEICTAHISRSTPPPAHHPHAHHDD